MRTDSGASLPIERLLIANRGEIAIRVIRACRDLGISPIAVHSDADAASLHVRMADRSERIGPAAVAASYLSIPAILAAAERSRAQAIHPGYGFLSENAGFARAVEEAGVVFIGPPAEAIEALGNKLAARRAVSAAGVPIVPGTTVALEDDVTAVEEIGFPVMLKAAAGGGGRGMRRVEGAAELREAMASARREAEAAFGDGAIYVERVISPARHVEVQLLGDRHGGLAVLGERDCSVQRRHQKLIEESPSPGIDDRTRAALFESARRVAGTIPFHNAATVEFLVDGEGRHYFLEMNTRLQVEHGVTELVTGLDLVAWQIRVAAGEHLTAEVLAAPRRGHAIEVRLYAEDPYDAFRPTAGRVTAWAMPGGPGVRVDAGMEGDTELRSEYDPLLAKVMVHGDDRPAALGRLRRALDETVIGGVQTDAGFLRWVADDTAFIAGTYDTGFIADRWAGGPPITDEERAFTALAASVARFTGRADAAPDRATDGAAEVPTAWARVARREALRR